MNFNFKRRIILYSSSINVSLCAVKHNYGRSCSLLIGLKFRNMSNIIDTRYRFTISSYFNINVQYISEVRPIDLM
jgi:hypothetical protein